MRSLALLALFALSSTVSAQTTPYVAEMRAAIGLLAAGDSSGAAASLRESIARAPTRPEAHCHLGAALTRLGNRDGALESYRACARLANRADDRFHEATGLHGVVRLLIEDAGRREEAKSAVEALRTFAIANPSVLAPEIPEEMAIALDRIEASDRAAAAVRQRREARRASGNVSSD